MDVAGIADLAAVISLLRGRRFVVLSGAGVSTDSGIPDYRGPGGAWRRSTPIQYQDFLRSAATRRRYWARSTVGWPRFSGARPNAAHQAVTALERAGLMTGLITQNVDGLHRAAGTERQIELHGRLDTVRCLGCEARLPRAALQAELEAANPGLAARDAQSRPDGDAELASAEQGGAPSMDDAAIAGFVVPACRACGGMLKPDVVFFGENVARPVVDAAFALVDRSEALLVLGSSLTVYSGFRFARRAAERGVPLCIINQGETRADALATLRLAAPLGHAVPALAAALGA